jgi:hypothetical protein
MNLRQLETVETELKHKRYNHNKVLKLTGLTRRLCVHQERLKRIKDGNDMAKTMFRGFTAGNQGPIPNYVYKPEVYNVKGQGWTAGYKN